VLLPGPAGTDKVTVALADGVLTATVPNAEAGKPRRTQVTAGRRAPGPAPRLARHSQHEEVIPGRPGPGR
jgi:hypothetical protein